MFPFFCGPRLSPIPQAQQLSTDSLTSQLSTTPSTTFRSQSCHATDSQSASLPWYQATIWDPQRIFLSVPWKVSPDICDVFCYGQEGSVIYNWYWIVPVVARSTELVTIS
jgi:hypothetical protein